MAMTVNMPQLGESVTEGTIARWLKQPGELVSKYESIAEVITDKVNAEIPAPAEGSMGEHIAKEGDVVAVGQAICTIETVEQGQANSAWHQGDEAGGAAERDNGAGRQPDAQSDAPPAEAVAEAEAASQGGQAGADVPAAAAAAPAAADAAPAEPAPAALQTAPAPAASTATEAPVAAPAAGGSSSEAGDGLHLTPAVRMLVREHGVDLAAVQGTGLGGRISKKDVLDHVQHRDAGTPSQAPAAATPAPAPAAAPPSAAAPAAPAASAAAPAPAAPMAASQQQPSPVAVAAINPASALHEGSGDELLPLTPIRRSIAEHMVRSKQTSPHAWLMMEVDMARVTRLRAGRRAEFEQRYGAKLTYLPFVARAVCDALRRYPTLNASWTDEGILVHREVHLGIAVALEDNLIVPVVRNADRLSVAGLATTMQDLGDRARSNKLKLDEIQGGTFTLNNTGALGTVLTSAIINQPQAAILAMDAVVKRAVVIDDAIAIRPMMNICLSFDHRTNDGLQATRFLKAVKDALESIDETGALL